jgi:uncharacterized protein with HEPN domain
MARGTRTRPPEALLGDIVRWGERLATHIAGMTRETFLQDMRTQDAVCKCVEVLGEAARGLMLADPGMEARHPDLALRLAYATRNQLSHGYAKIDYNVLWATAHDAAPKMVAAARALLSGGA